MEQPSPPVAEDDKATHPENNPPSQLGLCLSTIAIKPLFSDPFLAVYERLANLRKQGRDEDANTMDNSSRVAALCEISGAKQYQKSFNAIWSAKDFREALYHAVAPESGGPPWLRESFKIDAAQEMCMTRIPNVWENMFYQAEALTSIFIDPTDPAFTHIAQHITQKEVFKLKKLWSSDDKTLKMKDLESIFFPKVSKTSPIQQREYKTSSQVTGKDYSHGRTILTRASDEEYGKIFDRLAGHAQARTSVPPSLDWTSLAAPTQETGKLTNDILHHVISWFDSENHRKGAAKNLPLQWIDRLEAGPLANRGGPNDGVLMHTDKSSKEATRLLVQALFDKIREFHKLEDDWTKLVRQTPQGFYTTVSYFPTPIQQACYRYRFQSRAWVQILHLVKSYTGSQFKGAMDIYNEVSITTESQLQISISTAVEQFLVTTRLAYPPDLLFLNTQELQRDTTSEAKVLAAALICCDSKIFLTSDQNAASLAQSSQTQQIHQERAATARAALTVSAQILRNAGYNLQPEVNSELLTNFTLQRPASLTLRLSQQDEAADHASDSAGLINTQPEASIDVLAGASSDNTSISPEPPLGEGSEPASKKRKQSTQG